MNIKTHRNTQQQSNSTPEDDHEIGRKRLAKRLGTFFITMTLK